MELDPLHHKNTAPYGTELRCRKSEHLMLYVLSVDPWLIETGFYFTFCCVIEKEETRKSRAWCIAVVAGVPNNYCLRKWHVDGCLAQISGDKEYCCSVSVILWIHSDGWVEIFQPLLVLYRPLPVTSNDLRVRTTGTQWSIFLKLVTDTSKLRAQGTYWKL